MKKVLLLAFSIGLILLSCTNNPSSGNNGSNNPQEETDLEIKEYDSYCEVAGIGNYKKSELIIPKKYHGKPVTKIANSAFRSNDSFTKIVIPSSIIEIGELAFAYTDAIKEVIFEEKSNCKTIGKQAFALDSGFQSITIPKSVSSIGEMAFDSCNGLSNITFEADTALTEIPEQCFQYCKALKKINIPEGVKTIKKEAFSATYHLTEITIPESVETIESQAFHFAFKDAGEGAKIVINFNAKNCDYKKESVIGGDYMFDGFNTKTYSCINIGSSVERIPDHFTSYINMKELNFAADSKCKEIGYLAFIDSYYGQDYQNSTFISIELPENLETINQAAFSGNSSFKNVVIPRKVKYIGDNAFDERIESLTFEDSSNWYYGGKETEYKDVEAEFGTPEENAVLYVTYRACVWRKK